MTKQDDAFVSCLGVAVLFAALPLSIIFNGYVLSILWKWFFVSTFHIFPLTVPQALGVSLVIGKLTANPSAATKEFKTTWGPFASLACYPLMYLAIGWIVKAYL